MCCSPCCNCLRAHAAFSALLFILLAFSAGGNVHEMSLFGEPDNLGHNSSQSVTKLEVMVDAVRRGGSSAITHYWSMKVAVVITSFIWMAGIIVDALRHLWSTRFRRIYWVVAATTALHAVIYVMYAQVAFAYVGASPGTLAFAGANTAIGGLYIFSLWRSHRVPKTDRSSPGGFDNPLPPWRGGTTEVTELSPISTIDVSALEEARNSSSSSASSSVGESPSPPQPQVVTVAETHHI